ncbi:MAG: stearoyl-CoA desaturase (delta-9 desaturase) [Verrucomicrobiales bacterium]|jgi:stearoyl-CoA desaturase (delta-9 desaturase)
MFTNIAFAIVVGFVLTQIANVATTVYLHRSLAHRAVKFSPALTGALRGVIWLLTGIRPRQWAAVHRKHHAFTDEEDDPHSPLRLGWVRVQLTNVALYRAVARDAQQVSKYARDLPQTTADRYLLDHAVLGLGITTTFLIWWLGIGYGLLAAIFHFVLYLSLSAAVNAVAHTFGTRPFENSATNVRWLALLTSGEGLHNNHHAAPTSARFSLDKAQLDPGWWFIRAARKLGQASIRHEQPVFATPRRTPRSGMAA